MGGGAVGGRGGGSLTFENLLLMKGGRKGAGLGRTVPPSRPQPQVPGQMVGGGASVLSVPKTRLGGPRTPEKAAVRIGFGNNARGPPFLGLGFGVSSAILRVAPDLSRSPPGPTFPRDSTERGGPGGQLPWAPAG